MTFGRLLATLWLILALLAAPLYAQDEPAAEAEEETELPEDIHHAPVIVDGETLFLVRGLSSLPAEERAHIVRERIIEVADRNELPFITMDIKPSEFGPSIYADGTQVTVITDADAELEEMDIDLVAEVQSEKIEGAILNYRAARTGQARVDSLREVFFWSIAFAAFTWGLFRLRRGLSGRIARYTRNRLKTVEDATQDAVQAKAVAELARFVVKLVLLICWLVAVYFYLSLVLRSFAETREIGQVLVESVTDPILAVFSSFVRAIPNMVVLLIIALMTRYVLKGVRLFFDAVGAGTIEFSGFEKRWIKPTYNIIRGILILIAVVIAFPYIPGSDSEAFQGLALLLGLMVSLGSNSVVGNILSGLFVIYRRSMNIGDRIQVGPHTGDVVEIKVMETYIKSIKNELISIPNSQLLSSEVINFSRKVDGRGLVVHTTVGIGYEEPPEKVEAMLIEAARRTNGLKKTPSPFVLWSALADYAINYQINAFTTRSSIIPLLKSDLHRNIMAVFTENGVQIMTPSYMADTEIPKVPPEWDGKLVEPPE